MYRNTFLELNEDRYLNNIRYLQTITKKRLIPVLKANGYGTVDYLVANLAAQEKVDLIAVSSLSEAVHLRKNGIKTDILILGFVDYEYFDIVKSNDFSIVTVSSDYIYNAKDCLKDLKIHIKVDTGMNRIGIYPNEVKSVFDFLMENDAKVEGIMTHYAKSDIKDNQTTLEQYNLFENVVKELNYSFKYIHTSNTDASIHFNDSISTHIRCGIGLLGYSSYASNLKPCLSLKTQITNIKKVEAGSGIGYGHHYISNGEGWIATIPLGYADGFIRTNSGRYVFVDGEYAQIVGSICMDQTMILCKQYHPPKTEVEIFGEHITIEQMAKELNVINYEILVYLSDRITRVFKKDDGTITKIYTPRFDEYEY